MSSVQIALGNSYHVSGVDLNGSDRTGFLATCAKIILKCVVKGRPRLPWGFLAMCAKIILKCVVKEWSRLQWGFLSMCAKIILKCVVKEWSRMPWN